MIKSVKVTNERNEMLEMELNNPEECGFYIKSIQGLGPVKANVTTTDIVTSDGALFNNARLGIRNIVLEIGYLTNSEIDLNSIEDVRQKSYKYFPLKRKVRIEVVTDNRDLYTYGYVESNEIDIFSDKEGASISIICPNSFFNSIENKELNLDALESTFKFPFRVDEVDGDEIYLLKTDFTVKEINDDKHHLGNDILGKYKYVAIYFNIEGTKYSDLETQTYNSIRLVKEDQ